MKHSVDIGQIAALYAEGMTTRKIAEHVGIPARTVARYLKNAGVEMRPAGPQRHDILRDRDFLMGAYVRDQKSTTQIAEEIGASPRVVHSWLTSHGIECRPKGSPVGHTRNTEEMRRKVSIAKRGTQIGEDNPNWRGGTPSRDPARNRYPAKVWSKAVRERDGKCMECGATERLHAHHIKSWRNHPGLRYDVSNGITLCYSCHERAHGRGFTFRWPNMQKSPRVHRPCKAG